MITSHSRGHKIYYDGDNWRYCDDNSIEDDKRACIKCNKLPTPEGYDACLDFIEGAKSACCGHGIDSPFVEY